MAIGTTAAILGGIGLAGGAAKTIAGATQSKRARRAIANYDRQELRNPNEDLRISTLGADLQREEAARSQANIIDMIRMGGSRAIIGAAGQVASQFNNVNRQIASGLDEQMLGRERAIAEGAFRQMQMQERREEGDLAGLGNMYNVGQQNLWSGLDDVASAGMFLGNNLESALEGGGTGGLGHGAGGNAGTNIRGGRLAQATQVDPRNYNSAVNNYGFYGIG